MIERSGPKQMRWWAVLLLLWPLREAVEPARFAVGYSTSWATKLAVISGVPIEMFTVWFWLAGLLISTLIIALAVAPNSAVAKLFEKTAAAGLCLGSVGYGYLVYVARRSGLDVPPAVIDTYTVASMLLMLTAWPIGCWANERAKQKFYDSKLPRLDQLGARACDQSAS